MILILVLCIINFSTFKIQENILEYDAYIASKQDLINLQNEYSLKNSEIEEIKKLISGVPSGKEKAVTAFKYLRASAQAVSGISITNCTIQGENNIRITFTTPDTLTADSFDQELRNYFDFDKTFYNSNKESFSLELKLKSDI